MDAVGGAGLPGVRQAGAGRVEHGHHQGHAARRRCEAAIEAAREHDPKVVVEAGDRRPRDRVRACCRAATATRRGPAQRRRDRGACQGGHEFYDFEAKYLDEATSCCPARPTCPTQVAAEVQRLAARGVRGARAARGWRGSTASTPTTATWSSTRSTRCRGSRPHSMYPRMWAATGLDYPELIDELVQLALTRRTGLR